MPLQRTVFGTLLLAACATASPRIERSSESAFAASAAKMARGLAPAVALAPGEGLVIESPAPDGGTYQIHLTKVWQFCQDEPDDCDEGVERYLRQALERLRAKAEALE